MRVEQLPELWRAARKAGFAKPNIGLLTDMIACPGGDFCSLANARSLPIAEAITERYQDLDELHDIGEIDLHMSGCINSCGHHHSGHIGILGVDKDGKEWYQVTLGGSDGSPLSGPGHARQGGRPVVLGGRSARGDRGRAGHLPRTALAASGAGPRQETFIDTLRRVGLEPFKAAANGARFGREADRLRTLSNGNC